MAKTIEVSEEALKAYQHVTTILDLKDLAVVGQQWDEAEQRMIFTCALIWPVAICPKCVFLSQKVHDYPHQRHIHDIPIRGAASLLVFDARRFWCDFCRQPFTEQIRDIVTNCTYTYRLAEYLADPRRKQDVATLAATHGLGYKLVESILLKAAETKLEQRRLSPLQVEHLGIDEIALLKGHGDFVLVLTDLKRRCVLDILPDRKKAGLIQWLKHPPAGVDLAPLTTVATDLWTHYRDAVLAVNPTVSVVADRFHVVQQLHDVIHKSRREAQKKAQSDDERALLKGLRYLLLKDQSKLTETEKSRLEALQRSHPQLYQLYQLRQRLHDWYEIDTSSEAAAPALRAWIQDALALQLAPLSSFCNTLTNWFSEIISFFTHRITSGFIEGTNNKLKLLKRIAFGIPNFEHFRLRMLGVCG